MSDLQNDWLQLQRAALLGTQRTDAPTTTLSPAGNSADAEHQLLLALGLTDFYQEIGRIPPTVDAHALPTKSQRASTKPELTSYLNTMLDGRYRELLPELLQTLVNSQQTIARELQPNLLEYGNSTPQQRHLVFQSLGAHGQQLARQRPEWHYAADDIFEWDWAQTLWRHPKPAKRQAFLRQLRHLQPNFARELMESSWKAESQQQRLWFIRLLSNNLSMDDESFLEMALDDRMLAVRREAIKLLTMLPESKLCMRMTNATRLVLTWSKAEQRLIVRFPVGVSRLLQRDGVSVRANPKSVARLRGEQLTAMVLGVPLNTWTKRWGVSAETILASLPDSRWPRTLTKAFIEASLRQRNQEWALALLNHEVKATTAKLFGVLSAEKQASLLRSLAHKNNSPLVLKNDPIQLLLYQNSDAWTLATATIWLARVKQHFEHAVGEEPTALKTDLRNPLFISTIRKMARFAPIELANDIVSTLQPFSRNQVWRSKLQDIIGMLRFRQKLLRIASNNI